MNPAQLKKQQLIISILQNITNKDISKLSKIQSDVLTKMYENQSYKNLIDSNFTSLDNLFEMIKQQKITNALQTKELDEKKASDEENLKKLEQEEAAAELAVKEAQEKAQLLKELDELEAAEKEKAKLDASKAQSAKSLDINPVADSKSVPDAKSDDKGVHPQFYKKLTEMQEKLPPILGGNSGFVSYNQVADKEFCYKFLYCWLNNPINKTNESVQRVYSDIVYSYGITDKRLPPLVKTLSASFDKYNITFDVGFIINVQVPSKGGLIPTQKRRPNKSKKRNHTIKDRVKTR